MNISNTLAASFSLALITALSGTSLAGVGDDPRVRMVEMPNDLRHPWIMFSDEGETITLTRWVDGENQLLINQGEGWDLIKRLIGGDELSFNAFGVSDEGTVVASTDFENVSLAEGALATVLPRRWNDSAYGLAGLYLWGEVLSGDGLHVGVSGTPTNEFYSDALLWDGGSRYTHLSEELPQERRSYLMRGLSYDGTVAVFGAVYQAPLNNIRSVGSERDAWVWEEGELTMVPPMSVGYEVLMNAAVVSGNGQGVIGNATGKWRAGFGDDQPLTDAQLDSEIIRGPGLAWIWTHESGTVEIADTARFEEIGVWDITYDASTVLGNGYSLDTGIRQFLWYRDTNQFVMIDDLFAKLGIVIDADWYSFYQISGDGSKLLGRSRLDGHYSAIIVTIPVRNP